MSYILVDSLSVKTSTLYMEYSPFDCPGGITWSSQLYWCIMVGGSYKSYLSPSEFKPFCAALPTMICTSVHIAKWTKTIIRSIIHNINSDQFGALTTKVAVFTQQ